MFDEESQQPLVHELTEDAQGPESLMAQLRAKRDELASTKETFLSIVGYEELGLQAQHRLMDRPEVERIARKVMGETKDRGERNMRILLDQIINSTTGFFVQETPDGDPQQLLDDLNANSPITTWDQMAQFLGWQPSGNARAALYFVFADNEFAIGQYGIALNRWMGNTGIKVDEEFLGEGV